jgi:hypothetical protein
VKTITLDGYTRNGRKVEGTKTITYLGKVDGTHPRWEVKLVGGKITFKDGTTITMESTRTRTLIEGYATETFQDDIYEIDGTSSGVNRKGVAFSTVSENLVKAFKCPYFKSGKTTYVSEKKTVVTTYTRGEECSPSASIEVNGKTKTITTEE